MKRKLPIKLEIIALVLFSILGVFIIGRWKVDTNPDVDKYLICLSINFSVLLFLIFLIIFKLMKIFKYKDEKDHNTLILEDANGYYISANSFFNKGLYMRSISYYSKAIELNPKLAEAYENRGFAYIKIGACYKAIEDFNKSKKLKEEQELKN